jgi:hypothetical protein
MNTKPSLKAPSPQDIKERLKALTDIEHAMVAERLNLVRTMGRSIGAPELIERQAVAFVNVQARLIEARAERRELERQQA